MSKYDNILIVSKIEIEADKEILPPGSTVTLTASAISVFGFISGVEWRIDQKGKIVEVETKNDRKLVLKCLRSTIQKVTVIAAALNGSGVTAKKELTISCLSGTIKMELQSNQSIKATIKIKEEGLVRMDMSKSKYILNTSPSMLGIGAYKNSGSVLDELTKVVTFNTSKGTFFLHALVVDVYGTFFELVSDAVATNGLQFCFGFTGRIERGRQLQT